MIERKTITKLAATVPASEQKYVRWMRTYGIIVFVANPGYMDVSGNGYHPWMAINTNILVDPVQCDVHVFPKE